MANFEMDKLTEIISLRVSDNFKVEYESLTSQWKKKAKNDALLAMAKVIHESKFDAKRYIGDCE